MAELISANDADFDNYLNDGKAVIVDFWAPTCAPCKQLEPGLQQIADTYSNKVRVLKVNVNDSPRTSSRYFVRGLPTLLFIKNGSVKTQMVGAVSPNQIEKKLREVI